MMPYMHLPTFHLSRLRNSPPIGTWGAPSCSQTVGSIPAEKQHKGSFALCWVAGDQSRVGISFWTWLWSNQEKSRRANSEVFNKVVLWGDSISSHSYISLWLPESPEINSHLDHDYWPNGVGGSFLGPIMNQSNLPVLPYPMRDLEKQPGALEIQSYLE